MENSQEPIEDVPSINSVYYSITNKNKILVDEYQTKLKSLCDNKTKINRAQLDQIHVSLWIPIQLQSK